MKIYWFFSWFNPLQPGVAFIYPWKPQKIFRFSGVFRRYRKATPGCNGLSDILCNCSCIPFFDYFWWYIQKIYNLFQYWSSIHFVYYINSLIKKVAYIWHQNGRIQIVNPEKKLTLKYGALFKNSFDWIQIAPSTKCDI